MDCIKISRKVVRTSGIGIMTSTLSELQDWYAAQCDGDWEHCYGLSIGTLDNPGWCLCIDLEGTDLADVAFAEVKENYEDDLDWLVCAKHAAKFTGHGGPRKLERMMRIFLDWAKAHSSPEPGQPALNPKI
jgi:hypothetical protein